MLRGYRGKNREGLNEKTQMLQSYYSDWHYHTKNSGTLLCAHDGQGDAVSDGPAQSCTGAITLENLCPLSRGESPGSGPQNTIFWLRVGPLLHVTHTPQV